MTAIIVPIKMPISSPKTAINTVFFNPVSTVSAPPYSMNERTKTLHFASILDVHFLDDCLCRVFVNHDEIDCSVDEVGHCKCC